MISKKILKGKNATLPRRSELTREFRKDWKALQHGGANLIYRSSDEETVVFARAGSHSELFE